MSQLIGERNIVYNLLDYFRVRSSQASGSLIDRLPEQEALVTSANDAGNMRLISAAAAEPDELRSNNNPSSLIWPTVQRFGLWFLLERLQQP